ncbi:hypothetical protein WA026_013698 [Henosepilachna vigintioctopunctata]|uniref:MMS22-like C-terminal domain-containing protein n=1 Tax=Henosepilachna vigintioctopunctata TaxID=420089 RepID=A0AAW1UZA4_9CUCU
MLNIYEKKIFCCDTENPEYYINFYNGQFVENEDVLYLGNRKFHKKFLIEEISFISRYLKKRWIFVQNSVLLDNNLSFKEVVEARCDINKGFNSILCCLKGIHLSEERNLISECINSLGVSVLSLQSFEDKILMKFFSSRQTLNCPIYEYFHTYLDIQFYIVLIRLKCDTSRCIIEDNILKVMTDLIILSRKYFIKQFKISNSSFFCQCIKHSWLILKLIFKEHLSMDIFWKNFECILRNDDALFSFWIMRDIISIQEVKETSERPKLPTDSKFIKEKLKTALSEPSDKLNHLRLMYPLMCDIWLSENWVEVLLLLWDHFSKRLNNSIKYQSGFHINCVEFTELIDTIIFSPLDCDEEFEFFIGILLNYLKKQPNHWGKIKCRIFSQLSPFKIALLEDVGLCRVLELFICLMEVNCDELSKKIISIYANINDNVVTSTNVNIYVSFIIRYTRENKNIEKITPPLVRILHHASENQNNFPIIKEFFDGFLWIVKQSSNMQLHQWTLLDTWLMKYLATCYLPDLEAAIAILLFVIGKISAEDSWSHWNNVFKENVYIVLKQIGNTSSCPAKIGELVGEISCLSPDVLSDAFTSFNADTIAYQVTEKFLCTILKNYPTNVCLTQLQERIAVQSWIRICLFSTKNYEEITSNVMRLDNIPTCIKNSMNSPTDPLVTFIDILGTNKGLFISTPVLSRFCEMCFDNLDRSLTIHLPQIKNELVILRIYTCMALALIQCGSLLYDRYKTSSPVTKLISCLLFPTEFVMGKISHPFLDAIRKTWHLYFEGLLKLGVDNDNYIHRTLRDLISKYLPHYSVADSPIHLCLNRENTAKVILEKICSIYFKHPTREIELNVTKALKILDEYVKSSTAISLLKIVVNQTLFGLCEVYIFHNQRNLALSIIVYIVTCPFYDHLKEEILKSLLLLTEKHLAFNTKHYFNLIGILAKTIPSEIMILKESIVEKIKNIERIRGIGFDDNLRSHLASLSAELHC